MTTTEEGQGESSGSSVGIGHQYDVLQASDGHLRVVDSASEGPQPFVEAHLAAGIYMEGTQFPSES